MVEVSLALEESQWVLSLLKYCKRKDSQETLLLVKPLTETSSASKAVLEVRKLQSLQ